MILVTGANGFVGSAVVKKLCSENASVRTVTRMSGAGDIKVDDIHQSTNWKSALEGVGTVVHLAARVHVMNDSAIDPLAEFRRVNREGTMGLATAAAEAGVKRFIYVSSIKVNGEFTLPGHPFFADDLPDPTDPYGISKAEAELVLQMICNKSGMEWVIIRPTLVYGPGVKANFLAMMNWLYHGVPLPFGAIHNSRSLVAIDNLVDLVIACLTHHAAANQVFLASDNEDMSTSDLLRRMGNALGRPARLMPVPQSVLDIILQLAGRKNLGQRLCGSLQVDIRKARELLNWSPPATVSDALQKTAEYFVRYQIGKGQIY